MRPRAGPGRPAGPASRSGEAPDSPRARKCALRRFMAIGTRCGAWPLPLFPKQHGLGLLQGLADVAEPSPRLAASVAAVNAQAACGADAQGAAVRRIVGA